MAVFDDFPPIGSFVRDKKNDYLLEVTGDGICIGDVWLRDPDNADRDVSVDLDYLNEQYVPVPTPLDHALLCDRLRVILMLWETEVSTSTAIREQWHLREAVNTITERMELLLKAMNSAKAHRQHDVDCPMSDDPSAECTCKVIALLRDPRTWTPAADAATDEVLHDILSLVLHGDDLPSMETLQTWSPDQRQEAERWAALTHVRANDHDDVEVPPKPAFLGT